ncbi:hypothetical protein Drorol1_Dr00005643 [Drosera rotundifolia]
MMKEEEEEEVAAALVVFGVANVSFSATTSKSVSGHHSHPLVLLLLLLLLCLSMVQKVLTGMYDRYVKIFPLDKKVALQIPLGKGSFWWEFDQDRLCKRYCA